MTEEIDAVMFDAGGTLIETNPARELVVSRVLAEHGHDVDPATVLKALAKADKTFDEEFALLDDVDESWYWTKYDAFLLKELGVRMNAEEFMRSVEERFEQIIPRPENWVAYPDAKPVLERLRKRELKLGVVSNATDLARRVLGNLGLDRYLDFMILSAEVGVRKPAPKIFELALSAAGTRPNRSLYVGDRYTVDVLGAKRAGLNAVLVDRYNTYPRADCLRTSDLNFFTTYF